MVAFEALIRTARRLNARARRKLPPLIFMTDDKRTPNPEQTIAKLPRGAAIIFRNYDDPQRAQTALRLRKLCRARGILFLVSADVALAARAEADGIHLPRHAVRKIGRGRTQQLVTAAVHNEAELHRAERAGVDAMIVSPVFPTQSHPGAKALGLMRFAALAGKTNRGVYALGGITSRNAHRLLATKAIGIAAIGALSVSD